MSLSVTGAFRRRRENRLHHHHGSHPYWKNRASYWIELNSRSFHRRYRRLKSLWNFRSPMSVDSQRGLRRRCRRDCRYGRRCPIGNYSRSQRCDH